MQLKPGVRLNGIKPEMVMACMIINSVFESRNKNFVITSCTDGKHSIGSKHYSGYAIDCRTRHLLTSEADHITIDIKKALGDDFDVVLESNHIHIEFHPKEAY